MFQVFGHYSLADSDACKTSECIHPDEHIYRPKPWVNEYQPKFQGRKAIALTLLESLSQEVILQSLYSGESFADSSHILPLSALPQLDKLFPDRSISFFSSTFSTSSSWAFRVTLREPFGFDHMIDGAEKFAGRRQISVDDRIESSLAVVKGIRLFLPYIGVDDLHPDLQACLA